jgi:hypothetical protein
VRCLADPHPIKPTRAEELAASITGAGQTSEREASMHVQKPATLILEAMVHSTIAGPGACTAGHITRRLPTFWGAELTTARTQPLR